jgi:hypothetical protein
MYCSLGFRPDSSDMFGAGDHAPAGQINSPSARSLVKCVEAPTGLGHNSGHKSLSARSRVRKCLILNGEMSEWLKEHAWKLL